MSKLSKQLLSWLLLVAMLCTLLPTAVFADDAAEDLVVEPTEDAVVLDDLEPQPQNADSEETVTEETVIEETVIEDQLPEDTEEPEPVSFEDELEAEMVADSDVQYRIVHLDCGRKYFSKDWIIALINEMAADGYNQLQLAFGNDGLRFLLNDMSVTVSGKTYSSDNVTAGIQQGNKTYYNAGDKNELTQTEMDEIITHAQSKGIEVVPMMNMPGHMDAIVDAIEYVGISNAHYSGSDTSLALTNETAVAFAQALLEKYVKYFKEKNCDFFHIGADEYANDAFNGNMGFPNIGSSLYGKFVDYVNAAAQIVIDAGMTPRAWNDGIYYGSYTNAVNTQIQVTYWTPGWDGYNLASAGTLSGKGFDMINTHGDYYYVLGKNENWTEGNSTTHTPDGYTFAEGWSNKEFFHWISGWNYDTETISDAVGAMFCIWCDYPAAETETEVAANTRLILRAMGKRMQNESIDNLDTTVVAGGFNADGTLNAGGSSDGNDTVTVNGQEGMGKSDTQTLSLSNGETAIWTSSNESVITLASADASGVSTLATSVTAKQVTATAVGAGTSTITATTGTTSTTSYSLDITVPADSNEGDQMGSTAGKAIELEVGGTEEITLNKALESSAQTQPADTNVATATYKTESKDATTTRTLGAKQTSFTTNGTANMLIKCGDGYLTLTNNTLGYTTHINEATLFTVTKSNSSYTIRGNGYYVYYSGGMVVANTSAGQNKWKFDNSTGFYYESGSYNSSTKYYLTYRNGWTISTRPSAYTNAYSFETENVPGEQKTTITVTGVAPGETTLTVDGVTYPIRVKYNEKTITLVKNSETTDTQTKPITGDVQYGEGAGDLVTVTTNGKTVKFAAKSKTGTGTVTVGNTIYTVNVIEEDLTNVQPLTVEYWITNAPITDATTNLKYQSVSATDAYGADGIALADKMPETQNREDRAVEYWQVRVLDKTKNNSSTSGTEEQTDKAGDDETTSGSQITKIRYYNTEWQGLSGDEWIDIDTTNNQIVAYYMEIMDIANANGTSELHVNAADWGVKGDNQSGTKDYVSSSANKGFNSVSIQLVYEDGTTNPATTNAADLANKTFIYGHWEAGRGIGTLNFNGEGNFEIYKITAETGEITADLTYVNFGSWTGYGGPAKVSKFTWDNNEMTVWEDDAAQQVSIHNNAKNPNRGTTAGEEYYNNLMWDEDREAILIRVYVKTVVTEDSLLVHYIDQTNNNEFHEYGISVAGGTTFDKDFGIDANGAVVNGSVENYYGQTRTVSSDLTTMPEIGAQYRYSKYTCVRASRSLDGKEVYLYYTFDNTVNFVVDFGLALQIAPKDLNDEYKNLSADRLKELNVTFGGAAGLKYGTLKGVEGAVVYTPSKVLEGIASFEVYIEDSKNVNNHASYHVNVYPANNVMYEDGFVTAGDGWTQIGTASKSTQQAPNKVSDIYGHDTAYTNTDSTYSNGTALKATVNGANTSISTFTFTGDGLELMGECGQNTGVMYVRVSNGAPYTTKDGTTAYTNKVYIVDTYYNGTLTNGSGTVNVATLKQVPLVHDLELPYGEHTVSILGYNIKGGASQNAAVAAMSLEPGQGLSFAANRSLDIDAILAEMGDEDAVVEYISMNEVLGGSDEGVAVYADQVYDAAAIASSGYDVVIDGFRVYNTLETEPAAYAEQGAKFVSLYEKVNDSTWNEAEGSGSGIVYVENVNGASTAYGEYKNSGPENEIYLAKGQGIAFKVGATGTYTVQVSAKAINGTPKLNTTSSDGTTINTQTELYYKITPDQNGTFVIYNNGEGNSILSLVDLKVIGGTWENQAITVQELDNAVYLIQNPQDPEEPSEPEEPGDSDDDNDEEAWQNPFQDVILGKFYYEAIRWLHAHGIIKGMTESEFGLKEPADRAMVVAMLYRLEGEPEVTGTSEFSDVKKGSYYEKAVIWASENYLVGGYPDGTFRPKQKISREELITILYRYNEFKGKDPAGSADLGKFSDNSEIHKYAKNAMRWAVDNGIVKGYNEYGQYLVKPRSETIRSEMATLLYRVYNLINGN